MTNPLPPPDSPASARRRAELAQTWLAEDDVIARLGIAPQTLAAWRKARKLLAVWHAPESQYVYPPCQFTDAGLIREMEPLLRFLDYGVTGSGWDEIEWLYASNAFLNARRPADVLTEDPARVLEVAAQQFNEDPDSRW